MKCIILAAGYATRLYPLTQNFPKPLLKVKDKTILDWLIEDLDAQHIISEFIVVSNHKFAEHFHKWAEALSYHAKITVLDDGTTCNENRLGAVKDIAFAIKELSLEDDLMVIAGDNLTDFSLAGFLKFFENKKASCIMRYFEDDTNRLRRTGVISIDEEMRVVEMQEKPEQPKSNWAVPPFYIYTHKDTKLILQAVEDNLCNVDAPGDFIAWLCKKTDVFSYEMPGKRYDIGNLESYENIKKNYDGYKDITTTN